MAKAKAIKQVPPSVEVAASASAHSDAAEPTETQAPSAPPQTLHAPQAPTAPRRDFLITLLLLLALTATAFIWLDAPVTVRLGAALTCIIWIITGICAAGRIQAQRTARALQAIIMHDQVIHARLEPQITEEQSAVRMRHVSAWLVAILGAAASAVLWSTPQIERAANPYGLTPLFVGATVSIMLALAVAANAINRLKSRRLARDFRTALHSERIALETVGAVDALISVCLPTGERARFNQNFLNFVGRSASQMIGQAWLEAIHPDDRQAAIDLAAQPIAPDDGPRVHDMCVRHHSGEFMWLRETLVPRFDDKSGGGGGLIEFIATAINITPFVLNETELDKQIGALKKEVDAVNDELTETKAELSKTKTSRNRFEKGLDESREEIKNLQEALDKAESAVERTRITAAGRIKELRSESRQRLASIEKSAEARIAKLDDALKAARLEHQNAAAENKKLMRAFEKLQAEMAELRLQNGDVREQMTRHIKETREAKAEAVEASTAAAQHRAKNERLTQQCQELEAQIAAKDAALADAQAHAQEASAAASAEIERRLHEVSAEALATQLRTQLDGMQRMTSEMLAMTLDGPSKDAAYNAAATVRAMSDLVDQALHGNGGTAGSSGSAARDDAAARFIKNRMLASFDIRRTVQGVRDLLAEQATAKGAKIEVEVASNTPALVHGDDIEIRTAIMSLTQAGLSLVSDGTLIMRLSEDVNTAAHTTLRCALSHAGAKVGAEALNDALAIKSTDDSMPDAIKQPLAHQAASAWRTIRNLDGKHGFMLPDEGGFSVWFTFTLGRPAAARADAEDGRAERHSRAGGNPEERTASPDSPSEARQNSAHSSPPQLPSDNDPSAPTLRSMPRMPQEFLTCNLGEVTELGGDSMRIVCAKSKEGEVLITFNDVETDLELRAEVAWSKKISARKHDVGLKFLGVTPQQQNRILRIAMQHRKSMPVLENE